jgi:hypothetical protein
MFTPAGWLLGWTWEEGVLDTKGNPNISQLKEGLIPFSIKNKGNK